MSAPVLAYSSTVVTTHPVGCVCPTHTRARSESADAYSKLVGAYYWQPYPGEAKAAFGEYAQCLHTANLLANDCADCTGGVH